MNGVVVNRTVIKLPVSIMVNAWLSGIGNAHHFELNYLANITNAEIETPFNIGVQIRRETSITEVK